MHYHYISFIFSPCQSVILTLKTSNFVPSPIYPELLGASRRRQNAANHHPAAERHIGKACKWPPQRWYQISCTPQGRSSKGIRSESPLLPETKCLARRGKCSMHSAGLCTVHAKSWLKSFYRSPPCRFRLLRSCFSRPCCKIRKFIEGNSFRHGEF